MTRRSGLLGLSLGVLPVLAGCATVNPQIDYQHAAEQVTQATGQEVVYRPDNDDLVAEKIESLLADGITVDEAVRISLLNNRQLQAAFMDLGMARADVVQSGLLSNPTLGVSLRLPAGGGLANLEAGLAQNIADLWQIPVRKRAAERALDRTILEVARRAADLAFDTEVAYYVALGADRFHAISEENLGIARELLDMALKRQMAGAANELEVNLSRSLVVSAELAVESARLAAADARRALATLLSVTDDADGFVLTDPLPESPAERLDAERLIRIAREYRLDIRAAQQALAVANERLRLERRRVFPSVAVGVALERGERSRSRGSDLLAETARASLAGGALSLPEFGARSKPGPDSAFIIGPSLDLELPVFDQNQARIAKATFAVRRALKTFDALDRSVVQEVRAAVDRARTAWNLARIYRDRSIPLARDNLDLSRKSYTAGRASFLAVLEAQRFFLDSRSRYVEALTAAATTLPELARTVGLPVETILAQVDDEDLDPDESEPEQGVEP